MPTVERGINSFLVWRSKRCIWLERDRTPRRHVRIRGRRSRFVELPLFHCASGSSTARHCPRNYSATVSREKEHHDYRVEVSECETSKQGFCRLHYFLRSGPRTQRMSLTRCLFKSKQEVQDSLDRQNSFPRLSVFLLKRQNPLLRLVITITRRSSWT